MSLQLLGKHTTILVPASFQNLGVTPCFARLLRTVQLWRFQRPATSTLGQAMIVVRCGDEWTDNASLKGEPHPSMQSTGKRNRFSRRPAGKRPPSASPPCGRKLTFATQRLRTKQRRPAEEGAVRGSAPLPAPRPRSQAPTPARPPTRPKRLECPWFYASRLLETPTYIDPQDSFLTNTTPFLPHPP